MALSGSFEKYPVNKFGLYCSWSAEQNIPGYYSDVTVKVYIQSYALRVSARSDSTITCGDETYMYTAKAISYEDGTPLTKTLVGSHTFRVPHDIGGGNKSVTLSASWRFNGTYSGTYVGTITASSTISLDAIPRQSGITSLTVDSNNKVSVALNRYVDTFTHTVKYTFGTYSYTATGVGTSSSYTIPLDWLNAIPNNSTGVGSVQVSTYSGSTLVGDPVVKDFTVTVPDTVQPTVSSISWTKTSSEPSSWPITQDVSQGKLTMAASGAYGSTISKYSLTFAGWSSSSATLEVPNISSSGNLVAVAKVTDSRGRTASKEVTFAVSSYGKPNITAQAYRSDANGNEDDEGEFMRILADVSLTSVGTNALDKFVLGYKKHTDSSYIEIELDPGYPMVVSASSDNTWDWKVTAADAVSTVTLSGSIPTSDVIMDIKADGSGLKFGGVAEESGLSSAWDFTTKRIFSEKMECPIIESAIINATDMSAENVYAEAIYINNEPLDISGGKGGNYLPTGGSVVLESALELQGDLDDSHIILNNTHSDNKGAYVRYQVDGQNKAATGYQGDFAFLSSTSGSARIGVNDAGKPQYRIGNNPESAKELMHEGNIGSQSVNYATSSGSTETVGCRSISAAPTGTGCYPVSVTTAFTVGGVTFPANSTGMFIASDSKNATLYVIDSNGRIYTAFRSNSSWSNAKTVIDSGNISSQSVNYATSAGSSTKATQDASGNTITSTYATVTSLNSHINNKNNPHSVTAAQTGASSGGGDGSVEREGLENYATSIGTANNIAISGWYTSNAGTPDSNWWTILASVNSSTYQTQIAYRKTDGTEALRHKINGTWSEWEWVNPPLVPGTEYRTTKRWNNKAVYVKLVDMGTTPSAGSSKAAEVAPSGSTIRYVYATGRSSDNLVCRPFPIYDNSGTLQATARVTSQTSITVTSHKWAFTSAYQIDTYVEYTKT